MSLFKIVSLSFLTIFLGCQFSFASTNLDQSEGRESMESARSKGLSEANEAFFKTVCVYQYETDQEKEVLDFCPKESDDLLSQLEAFGPVHVNLVDNEQGDGTLEKLVPFAQFIHGLSLEGNDFSTEELTNLSLFSELRFLDLTNTLPLVKPSLEPLYDLKHLETLVITYNNGLTRTNEVAELTKVKPDLKIIDEK
mgnify:CR=1 FL=1|tara:strand:- start:2051 stop:2638 length:588 start_codon:yes stop_codon:yes gene_type:complete